MRHLGILAGAALAVLVPAMASAQMGAPAGAPMQPGSWSQGGWQAGGTAAPTYEPGAPGYARGYAQDYAGHDRMNERHGDYRHLARGKRLPGGYMDSRYTVSDWNDWGFAPPDPGLRWVRYYDDGLLVDDRGRIVDARYGVDWNRRAFHGPRGFGPGPVGGYGPGPVGGGYAGGPGYPPPGVTTFRAGPNTVVTTAVVQAPPPVIVGGYYGGASVVAVTPGIAVTTTTTTTDYETVYKSVAVRQRAWRRPIRHVRPRCVHTTSCPVLGS